MAQAFDAAPAPTPDPWEAFKDSKVRDADGGLLKVFHATRADPAFDTFDRSRDMGFHFGASQAANRAFGGVMGEGMHIYPVHLNLRNPLRVPDQGSWQPFAFADSLVRRGLIDPGVMDEIIAAEDAGYASDGGIFRERPTGRPGAALVMQALERAGYDGLVYQNTLEATNHDPRKTPEEYGYRVSQGTIYAPRKTWGDEVEWVPLSSAQDDQAVRDWWRSGGASEWPLPTDSYMAFRPEQIQSVFHPSGTRNEPPINLTEPTAEMLDWHKDAHPLLKNEDGSPRAFYHATDRGGFDTFQMGDSTGKQVPLGQGAVHFSPNPAFGSEFLAWSGVATNGYLDDTDQVVGASVYPAYLGAKKVWSPYSADDLEALRAAMTPDILSRVYGGMDGFDGRKPGGGEWHAVEEAFPVLRRLGYDAIQYREHIDPIGHYVDNVAVFNPEQIKTVWNQRPTSDPRLLMSEPTAEMLDWHKDSDALTKNPDGSPRVFYHATKADFDAFDPSYGEVGSHFASDPRVLEQFSRTARTRPDAARGFAEGARVVPVLIKGRRFFRMNDRGGWRGADVIHALADEGVQEAMEWATNHYPEDDVDADARAIATRAGYDGIVYRNEHEGVVRRSDGKLMSAEDMDSDPDYDAEYGRGTMGDPDSKFEASDSFIVFEPSNIKSLFNPRPTQDVRLLAAEPTADMLAWHRDAHPLLKNPDGTPKTFYHGTSKGFNKFNSQPRGTKSYVHDAGYLGQGSYFTADPGTADSYAQEASFREDEDSPVITSGAVDPLHGFEVEFGSGSQIYPVHLNIRNPYMGSGEEFGWKANNGAWEVAPREEWTFEDEVDNSRKIREILEAHGYDGVLVGEGQEVVAFHPEQIKTVWNQKPTGDPRLLMAELPHQGVSRGWDPSKHPRQPDGKFAPKGGGGTIGRDPGTDVSQGRGLDMFVPPAKMRVRNLDPFDLRVRWGSPIRKRWAEEIAARIRAQMAWYDSVFRRSHVLSEATMDGYRRARAWIAAQDRAEWFIQRRKLDPLAMVKEYLSSRVGLSEGAVLEMPPGAEPVYGGPFYKGLGARSLREEGFDPYEGAETAGPPVAPEPWQELVDTPEFKRWYGESVLRDEGGLPRRVFHSTRSDFDQFEKTTDVGFHFGTSDAADHRNSGVGERIIPAYVRIENPLRVEDQGHWTPAAFANHLLKHSETMGLARKIKREMRRQAIGEPGDESPEAWNVVREALKQEGYDGLVYENVIEAGLYPSGTDPTGPEFRIVEDPETGTFNLDRQRRGLGGKVRWEGIANAAGPRDRAIATMAKHLSAFNKPEDSYVAFDPDQIKSSFNARPTADPRLLMSELSAALAEAEAREAPRDDRRAALVGLRDRLARLAGEDTAYDASKFRAGTLSQHCGPVSNVVQRLYGGDLVGGKVGEEPHIWNRLPDGTEVDLTGDQYGGDGYTPVATGRVLPARKTVNARNAAFWKRYEDSLAGTGALEAQSVSLAEGGLDSFWWEFGRTMRPDSVQEIAGRTLRKGPDGDVYVLDTVPISTLEPTEKTVAVEGEVHCPERVEHYRRAIRDGEVVEPLIVGPAEYDEGVYHHVKNGHHRYDAYVAEGVEMVPVWRELTAPGTRRSTVEAAILAEQARGFDRNLRDRGVVGSDGRRWANLQAYYERDGDGFMRDIPVLYEEMPDYAADEVIDGRDVRFRLRRAPDFGNALAMSAQDAATGEGLGQVFFSVYRSDPTRAGVGGSAIREAWRGRGLGRRLYEHTVGAAHQLGASVLESDHVVSPLAGKVWLRLGRLGYDLENNDWDPEVPGRDHWGSGDPDVPVYRVKTQPVLPNPNAVPTQGSLGLAENRDDAFEHPELVPLYHGTSDRFEGAPSAQAKSGTYLGKASYWTTDPDLADDFTRTEHGSPNIGHDDKSRRLAADPDVAHDPRVNEGGRVYRLRVPKSVLDRTIDALAPSPSDLVEALIARVAPLGQDEERQIRSAGEGLGIAVHLLKSPGLRGLFDRVSDKSGMSRDEFLRDVAQGLGYTGWRSLAGGHGTHLRPYAGERPGHWEYALWDDPAWQTAKFSEGESQELVPLYHGTTAPFEGGLTASVGKTGPYGKVMYWTSDPAIAGDYAKTEGELGPGASIARKRVPRAYLERTVRGDEPLPDDVVEEIASRMPMSFQRQGVREALLGVSPVRFDRFLEQDEHGGRVEPPSYPLLTAMNRLVGANGYMGFLADVLKARGYTGYRYPSGSVGTRARIRGEAPQTPGHWEYALWDDPAWQTAKFSEDAGEMVTLTAVPQPEPRREDAAARTAKYHPTGPEPVWNEGTKTPGAWYHTAFKSFDEFKPRKSLRLGAPAIFLSPDPQFYSGTGTEGTQVFKLRVNSQNPWDYENPEHRAALIGNLRPGDEVNTLGTEWQPGKFPDFDQNLAEGSWDNIESLSHRIKELGFDSFFVHEGRSKNLGVFDPRQVEMDWSPSNDSPKLLASEAALAFLAEPPKDISPHLLDEHGAPRRLYHGTFVDFDEFKPGGYDPELSGTAIWMTAKPDQINIGHQISRAIREGKGWDASGHVISKDLIDRMESGRLNAQQREYTHKRIGEARSGDRLSGLRVWPIYADIKNPAVFSGETDSIKPGAEGPRSHITLMYPDYVKELRDKGYDGAVSYDADGNLEEVVAFLPSQVVPVLAPDRVAASEEDPVTRALREVSMAPSANYAFAPDWESEGANRKVQVGEPGSFAHSESTGTYTGHKPYTAHDIDAFDDTGRLVGVFSMLTSHPDPRVIGALKITVRPDAVRQGWASRILDEAERAGLDLVGSVGANKFTSAGRALMTKWLERRRRGVKLAEPARRYFHVGNNLENPASHQRTGNQAYGDKGSMNVIWTTDSAERSFAEHRLAGNKRDQKYPSVTEVVPPPDVNLFDAGDALAIARLRDHLTRSGRDRLIREEWGRIGSPDWTRRNGLLGHSPTPGAMVRGGWNSFDDVYGDIADMGYDGITNIEDVNGESTAWFDNGRTSFRHAGLVTEGPDGGYKFPDGVKLAEEPPYDPWDYVREHGEGAEEWAKEGLEPPPDIEARYPGLHDKWATWKAEYEALPLWKRRVLKPPGSSNRDAVRRVQLRYLLDEIGLGRGIGHGPEDIPPENIEYLPGLGTNWRYYPAGPEREYNRNMGGTMLEEIPDVPLYHATTGLSSVRRAGRLKSPDELYDETGGRPTGLGGGDSAVISTTTDKALAENIADVIRLARQYIGGDITSSELIRRAKAGEGAKAPYYHPDLDQYFKDADSPTMYAAHGMSDPAKTIPKYQQEGWETWVRSDPSNKWSDWVKPKQPEDVARSRFTALQYLLNKRQQLGGVENPWFGFSNPEFLSKIRPEDIGVVTLKPKKGARGYYLPAEREWRALTGKALELVPDEPPKVGLAEEDGSGPWRTLEGHRFERPLDYRIEPSREHPWQRTLRVYDGDRAVGSILFSDESSDPDGIPSPPQILISEVDAPTYRGKGVGRAMYESWLREMAREGHPVVWSDSSVSTLARKVYDRLRDKGHLVTAFDEADKPLGPAVPVEGTDPDIDAADGLNKSFEVGTETPAQTRRRFRELAHKRRLQPALALSESGGEPDWIRDEQGNPRTFYHGTTADFEAFKPGDPDASIDRMVGTHLGYDPGQTVPFTQQAYVGDEPGDPDRMKLGGRVIPVRVRARKVFRLPQMGASEPRPSYVANTHWVETDQEALFRNVLDRVLDRESFGGLMRVAFRSNPDLVDWGSIYDALSEGREPSLPESIGYDWGHRVQSGRPITPASFVQNWSSSFMFGVPPELRQGLARRYLQSLASEGYDAIEYTNTAPMETEWAKDRRSLIALRPSWIKSQWNDDPDFEDARIAASEVVIDENPAGAPEATPEEVARWQAEEWWPKVDVGKLMDYIERTARASHATDLFADGWALPDGRFVRNDGWLHAPQFNRWLEASGQPMSGAPLDAALYGAGWMRVTGNAVHFGKDPTPEQISLIRDDTLWETRVRPGRPDRSPEHRWVSARGQNTLRGFLGQCDPEARYRWHPSPMAAFLAEPMKPQDPWAGLEDVRERIEKALSPAGKGMLDYLLGFRRLGAIPEIQGARYPSHNEFLLRHGRGWGAAARACAPSMAGRSKECYNNAQKLALRYPNRFAYVEGEADSGIIPTSHAWVVDRQGNVYDPTWPEGTGKAYVGVPFSHDYLRRVRAGRKRSDDWPLINNWRGGFPLQMGTDPSEEAVLDYDAWIRPPVVP